MAIETGPHRDEAQASDRETLVTNVERLWQLHARHAWWTCELTFISESYGWMAWVFRGGSKFAGRRTILRSDAIAWADDMRRDIESDWASVREQDEKGPSE